MTAHLPIVLERDNVNDETVTLIRWFASHGEWVESDALLAEVETSKANIDIHAPAAGYLLQEFSEGAEIPVAATIGFIAEELPSDLTAVAKKEAAAPAGNVSVAPVKSKLKSEPVIPNGPLDRAANSDFSAAAEYKQRFSPLAARLMEGHGVPREAFAGKSVVRKQDVLDYLNPPAPPGPMAPAATVRFGSAQITQAYREISLNKRKRSEATNLGAGMGNAVASSVSVTCFTQGLRRILEASSGGSNPSAIIVFEVSRLLRKYPALNAVYRNGAMLQYEAVNMGFAMDDGRGLKVAVIPNCDERPLQEIADMLGELSVAYIEDKLTPAQIANPTFTISDMSGLGVAAFLPLISDGQGAILGVGGEQFAPGSDYGSYTLTLTFDHQLSDGRTAALFLNDLKFRLRRYEDATEVSPREKTCSRCFSTVEDLRKVNEQLLLSAEPGKYLCTLCASGH
ncbi:MAG: 2-oxo acid dehydrogenase subunit E2 [Terracidiphilus sp.]